ncbi:hypothetical protein ACFOW4_20750 [Micromonospora sp. GCM10011542]|uniref:hypothetical protein n=1 Tax=Micromonospora sp. GCM10011542 TaxID=3317337 RepID=UPI003611405F
MPSRLTPGHLRQPLADDGQPAGPPPIATGPVQAGTPIEVERLVNANGLISLAGRQHPVGYHFAGRRVTVRLDRGLMQITTDGVLLRSLPNPLTQAEAASIRDARPAGPPPASSSEHVWVERRVRCRGSLVIAGQRIHVGIAHAAATITVEDTGTTCRVYDGDQLVTEVPRTTTKAVTRFKARRPEPPRRPALAPLPQQPSRLRAVQQLQTPSCPPSQRLIVAAQLSRQQVERLIRPRLPNKLQQPATQAVITFNAELLNQLIHMLTRDQAQPLEAIFRLLRITSTHQPHRLPKLTAHRRRLTARMTRYFVASLEA